MHRRRTGFSQRELEVVLGYLGEGAVSQHERMAITPPLKMAIGYEIIFRVPVAELFAGVRDSIEDDIEIRLARMEESLGQRSATDRQANATARKLMWLRERQESNLNTI